MDIINAFLTAAATAVTNFTTVLVNAASGIGSVLYDTTSSELTIVGAVMAFSLGVGVVYLLFRMVRGLIKQNNRG